MTLSKKAYVEECVFQLSDPSDISLPGGQGDIIPETPTVSLPVSSSQREAPKPEVSTCAQEHVSGFEDLHVPSSDQFTVWCKKTTDEILTEYVVDITELWQISVTLWREFRLHLLNHPASTNSSLLNHLCRRGSAFTSGTLAPTR